MSMLMRSGEKIARSTSRRKFLVKTGGVLFGLTTGFALSFGHASASTCYCIVGNKD